MQARQNRTWEFDLEEGMLDAAKLARVVTQPLFLCPIKWKDTNFKDTIVSILMITLGQWGTTYYDCSNKCWYFGQNPRKVWS